MTKTKQHNCSTCRRPGHNARTCPDVSKTDVEAAFEIGGFTINERFPECGFIYFPASRPWTKENEDQGRVFWKVEGERTDVPITREQVWINESWSYPNARQIEQLYKLVHLYVNYKRQQKAARKVTVS